MERKKNIAEIKRLLSERKTMQQAIFRFLQSKGISPSLSEEIAEEFVQKELEFLHLKDLISKRITQIKRKEITHKSIALIGPHGVGKTAVLLKLAHYFQEKGKKVVLHSSSFQVSEEYDHLLIDTQLKGPFYHTSSIDQLGEELAPFGQVLILLTLSAASKEVDLFGAIHQFSLLSPSGLIFTKVDETLTLGNILNVLQKTEMALHFLADKNELWAADIECIVRKILIDFNQEEFQMIRQFVMSN